MPVVTARVDSKLKEDSVKVLESMGFDMSTAINVFLRQVALRKEIPFDIKAPK